MKEFLIVGAGFSGIAFSWELEKQNISYHLVDPGVNNSATIISGGLINPITGRKPNLQWNIDTLIPLVKKVYSELEEKLKINIYSERKLLRIHKSEQAREEWFLQKNSNNIQNYIDETFDPNKFNRFLDFRHGALCIKNVLLINTQTLSEKYLEYIHSKCILQKLNYEEITILNDHFLWNNISYKNIVFCEGVGALQNSWFKDTPFKPAKGECLIIEIPNFEIETVIHKGIILIPLSGNRYWAGATNSWDDLEIDQTEAGLAELESGLQQLLKVPYKILEHKVAIRPTIRDRTPVVGSHPEFKNMFILNGMGTKGAMLSNFYAQILLEHIQTGIEIPKQANIARFYDILRK